MSADLENEHHKVVIAAAVAAIYGAQARVRQIRAVHDPLSGAWARQGRISVQSSHNLGALRWGMPPRGSRES